MLGQLVTWRMVIGWFTNYGLQHGPVGSFRFFGVSSNVTEDKANKSTKVRCSPCSEFSKFLVFGQFPRNELFGLIVFENFSVKQPEQSNNPAVRCSAILIKYQLKLESFSIDDQVH